METNRRILVHGLLASVTLMLVGVMYSRLASIWIQSHPIRRLDTDAINLNQPRVTLPEEFSWRVPAVMGAMGFALVLIAESILSMWKPVTKPAPRLTPEQEAEALLQKLLSEAEQNLQQTPPPKKSMNQQPSDSEREAHAQES